MANKQNHFGDSWAIENLKVKDLTQRRLITISMLMEYTQYSKAYIYKRVHERKIPFYKPQTGRRLFFDLAEIETWLTSVKGNTETEILKTIKSNNAL